MCCGPCAANDSTSLLRCPGAGLPAGDTNDGDGARRDTILSTEGVVEPCATPVSPVIITDAVETWASQSRVDQGCSPVMPRGAAVATALRRLPATPSQQPASDPAARWRESQKDRALRQKVRALRDMAKYK